MNTNSTVKQGSQMKRKPVNLNNQLSSKLSELFKLSVINEKQQTRHISARNLPPLHQNSVDGVHHINFFTNVKTELGALLSTENRLPFIYGTVSVNQSGERVVDGKLFDSLKCLWAYYRTGCLTPEFITTPDYNIRRLYRAINTYPKQESIFAIMVMGYYCKMLAYPDLAEALVNCKLPFDYYSERDGVKTRTSVSKLMINAIYEVRRALKYNELPWLESFLSKEDLEKASNVLHNHRHEYIVNMLLSENKITQNFNIATAGYTDNQLAKLKIDFSESSGVKKPVTKKTIMEYADKRKMDEAASLLFIPLTVPPVEAPEQLSETPNVGEEVNNKLEVKDSTDIQHVDESPLQANTENSVPVETDGMHSPEDYDKLINAVYEIAVDLGVQSVSEEVVLHKTAMQEITE